MKRAASWCVIVLLSCLGLVACGSGPAGPIPSPPPTTPASATASPSPSAVAKPVYKPATATSKALNVPVPVMPEAAKKKTPEGAKAFVGYWASALSYGYETGVTAPALSLGTADCQLCHSIPRMLEGKWSEGGWIEGGKLKAGTSEVRAHPTADRIGLVAQFTQDPFKVHRKDGSVAQNEAGDTLALGISLEYTSGTWKIRDAKLWAPK